mmetsp:Transcript_27165/g.63438  ORF Transcript_27165/g.63438 Transcript_27165/m.63438 type:complete len:262 (-) Transcript_27165:183-968(-)
MGLGAMPNSSRPGAPPSGSTTSVACNRTSSAESHGPGNCSTANPMARLSAWGTLTALLESSMLLYMKSVISFMVYTLGPASEYVCPAVDGSASALKTARATLSTCTGCCLAMPPLESGKKGTCREIIAMRLRNLSSSPKSVAGRRIVADGNASLRAASPTAFERAHAEGESSAAASAETWMSRSTPFSAHTSASTDGKLTLMSLKDQRLVSVCLPSKLITTLLSSTAASMSSRFLIDVFLKLTTPRSPIGLRWRRYSSSPR